MFEDFFEEKNLPNYKLKQLYEQYYKNPINSWDELTTWSKDMRKEISSRFPFSKLNEESILDSSDRRSKKVLFLTKEGFPVETVLMKSKERNTVCVSCMSGCPVGCTFCATGRMGFNKALDTQEIIDQVMYFKRELFPKKENISNIVFMGMGEPMLNMKNVVNAIRILTDPEKIALSPRRITVSTVGYVENLRKFLNMDLGVKIAVSLHAPNQKIRERIMPVVAKTNSLEDLMDVLISYQKKTRKRVTYEYLLLKDINDSVDHAKELSSLLRNQIALVNLINFNPSTDLPYSPTSKKKIEAFQSILNARGIGNTLRHSYGEDIKAACGQLASLR